MSGNFEFLQTKWPILVNLVELAENNLYSDPNTTLIKLRIFLEKLVDFIFAEENMSKPLKDTLNERLKYLNLYGCLPYDITSLMHIIKNEGNKATHEGVGDTEKAKVVLSHAHDVAKHIAYVYSGQVIKTQYQVPKKKPDKQKDIDKLEKDYNKLEEGYKKLLLTKDKSKPTKKEISERRKRAIEASQIIPRSEAETRVLIDVQLRKAGWEADTQKINYKKGVKPQPNKNLAIAEWPTQDGFADYALFVGLELLGIVEAKKYANDVMDDLSQAMRYSEGISVTSEFELSKAGSEKYKAPFLFASNGRPYLKQLEQKSGIWFLDARLKTNNPRPLQGWFSPDGLMDLLKKDIAESLKNLKQEPFDYLTDRNGLSLREYQINVIKKVEESIINGQRQALIVMATGTGKTRTTIGLAYRFIKTKRFKRILFLVDRTALGDQASDAYKDATIEDLMTFNKIYGIRELKDKKPDIETKVHFATVQGLIKRIYHLDDDDDILPVNTYDCIIVDEAHRGYFLDKDLTEEELLYKNQLDYVSKYRQVIDYFDAVKIALTATPAIHTVDIFGEPVASYSYREAVLDGFLIDHDPPIIISTELSKEGIQWQKGEKVDVYLPETQSIDTVILNDELNFDVGDFNKKVLTEAFNRVVVDILSKCIDPDDREKTLIFAANNDHADLLVRLLKEAYGLIHDDAIMKITAAVDDVSKKIRCFKNELYPSIVVTVDLLSTGIDVSEICNIVFLRRVRSRILYEQMLGRATRLCDEIHKDHFAIYDAVGLYETLKPYSQMRPVVKQPKTTIIKLIDEIDRVESKDLKKDLLDTIIAKIHRKERNISDHSNESFQLQAKGSTVSQFVNELKSLPLEKKIDFVKENKDSFELLDNITSKKAFIYIDQRPDELNTIVRGYGESDKPEDYIQSFNEYINNNKNKIAALKTVLQRPKDLTRKDLKSLLFELSNEGYTIRGLRTAWKESRNEDIAASIIGFIRQQALGDPLIPHEKRIDDAIDKIKGLNKWDKRQLKWIDRIGTQMKKELVLDKQSFEMDPFKQYGGFNQVDKILNNELDNIMEQINDELYSA